MGVLPCSPSLVPEAYLAGSGVLVGTAAVLLLATTKRGQELLIRTAQLALHTEADEQEHQESDVPGGDEDGSQESDVQEEDVRDEPAEVADIEEEPEDQAHIEEESKVTDLKPRAQRQRSAAPGRRPRSATKAPAPAES